METALTWNRLRQRTIGATKTGTATQDVALPPRSLWSIQFHAGDSVTCKRGLVWLTQSGDTNDYILRAGECFTAQRYGRVVAQALEDSQLCVESTSEKQ